MVWRSKCAVNLRYSKVEAVCQSVNNRWVFPQQAVTLEL